jgi:hypothetical protein
MVVYFVIDSVRKLLDIPSYLAKSTIYATPRYVIFKSSLTFPQEDTYRNQVSKQGPAYSVREVPKRKTVAKNALNKHRGRPPHKRRAFLHSPR